VKKDKVTSLKVHKGSKEDGLGWSPIQIILQEIQADDEVFTVVNDTNATIKEQYKRMPAKIKELYADDPAAQKELVESIPSYSSVLRWTRLEGWKDAVFDRIRGDHIFNNNNRTKVLNSILKAATTAPGSGGNIRAAELYWKLEGSLNPSKEKEAAKDASYERYKSLQKTLHNKK
jgi:hypothetical protein